MDGGRLEKEPPALPRTRRLCAVSGAVTKMLAGGGFHTVESSGARTDLALVRRALIGDAWWRRRKRRAKGSRVRRSKSAVFTHAWAWHAVVELHRCHYNIIQSLADTGDGTVFIAPLLLTYRRL